MRSGILVRLPTAFFAAIMTLCGLAQAADAPELQYEQARWDPIHFKPAIDSATNRECLACHQEIMSGKVSAVSRSGAEAVEMKAWYQTLTTYSGEQLTFHSRHLDSSYATKVMSLKCNTCHQGNDPREEAQVPPDHSQKEFTLRKMVNPDICLMCHGRNPYEVMGMISPWSKSRELFQDNCLLCHNLIRTNRHQVNFLKADAIEKEGAKDSDVCYGCHGGRQWYRIPYPYPRHKWKGMGKHIPDWAKDRPTESEPRFRLEQKQALK